MVLIAETPQVLVARKDLPADKLPDFIAYAKANQARMQYGSAGAGSPGHLTCMLFNAASGINVDLEIYAASGDFVAQRIVGGQSFAAGQAKTYGWPYPVPAGLAPGTYTVMVGVFSSDWTTLYTWESHAATFAVE